jgi:hypothetical protein
MKFLFEPAWQGHILFELLADRCAPSFGMQLIIIH